MMRKSKTRCMSLLLALSLLLSLSAPGNYSFVNAEGSNSESSTTTENDAQTESYSIVFLNDNGKELEENSATIDYNRCNGIRYRSGHCTGFAERSENGGNCNLD